MGANDDNGVIDLDRFTKDTAATDTQSDGRRAWRLRDPWPRPLLIAVTAIVAVIATILTVRATEGSPTAAESSPAAAEAASPWAALYGSAMLKIRNSGPPVFDGISAVDSGYRLESTLDPGDYRIEFACASELSGVAVEVLVRGGDGDMVSTRADCDLDRTDADFTVDEAVPVSVWVGSYQEASTAYAFAVMSV